MVSGRPDRVLSGLVRQGAGCANTRSQSMGPVASMRAAFQMCVSPNQSYSDHCRTASQGDEGIGKSIKFI